MQFGLYGGGAMTASIVGRVPRLSDRLGPVAAATYRLASRIVNGLRAGYAAKSPDAFAACPMVLVRVPYASVPVAVARLTAAAVDWRGKSVLLCESDRDSAALDPLRARGAATGTLEVVEGCPGCYVVEGDRAAMRHAQALVRWLGGRAVELDRAHLALYEAGLAMATSLFTPLVAASAECLAAAGRSRDMAGKVALAMFQNTLRAWARHGRKSWAGPADEAALRRQLAALDRHQPALAKFYRHAAVFGLEYFGRK